MGDYLGLIKGDTRSVEYGSHGLGLRVTHQTLTPQMYHAAKLLDRVGWYFNRPPRYLCIGPLMNTHNYPRAPPSKP